MAGNPTDPQQKPKDLSGVAFALNLGTQMMGALIAGAVPGWWLDKRLGMGPWLTLVGVLSGLALGFFLLVRTSKQQQDSVSKHR